MRRFLFLTVFCVAAAVTAPVSLRADDRDDHHHDKRYYDRDARDYHGWDDHEDRAYRAYMVEQHRDYREFRRIKAADQREYFRWRHVHPDDVLFKVEIR